jgi:hypothetical protein
MTSVAGGSRRCCLLHPSPERYYPDHVGFAHWFYRGKPYPSTKSFRPTQTATIRGTPTPLTASRGGNLSLG